MVLPTDSTWPQALETNQYLTSSNKNSTKITVWHNLS